LVLASGHIVIGNWKEGKIAGPVEFRLAPNSYWANPEV
jgi:hypothetical protein